MSANTILALCPDCKVGTPFETELVNPNYEMLKCEGCKKRRLCQTFRIVTKRRMKNGEATEEGY